MNDNLPPGIRETMAQLVLGLGLFIVVCVVFLFALFVIGLTWVIGESLSEWLRNRRAKKDRLARVTVIKESV